MKLSYVMKFVANMDAAVKFYRDTMGLPLKFPSPGWSEFDTGTTVFTLHPSSEHEPPGKVELGFSLDDLAPFYDEMTAKGVKFSMPPNRCLMTESQRQPFVSTKIPGIHPSRHQSAPEAAISSTPLGIAPS